MFDICSVVFIEFSNSRSLPETSVTSSSMTNSHTVFLYIQKNGLFLVPKGISKRNYISFSIHSISIPP